MAIAVRHKVGQREAVLEFPPGPQPRYGAPQLKVSQIAPELVAKAIASAFLAGWEPGLGLKGATIAPPSAGRRPSGGLFIPPRRSRRSGTSAFRSGFDVRCGRISVVREAALAGLLEPERRNVARQLQIAVAAGC
jgi:hypothetical protein